MSRLIDADALKEKAVRMYGFGDGKYVSAANIDRQPTIDAVPVVRCKECVGYREEDGVCVAWEGFVRTDDFCSYGKRRSDA